MLSGKFIRKDSISATIEGLHSSLMKGNPLGVLHATNALHKFTADSSVCIKALKHVGYIDLLVACILIHHDKYNERIKRRSLACLANNLLLHPKIDELIIRFPDMMTALLSVTEEIINTKVQTEQEEDAIACVNNVACILYRLSVAKRNRRLLGIEEESLKLFCLLLEYIDDLNTYKIPSFHYALKALCNVATDKLSSIAITRYPGMLDIICEVTLPNEETQEYDEENNHQDGTRDSKPNSVGDAGAKSVKPEEVYKDGESNCFGNNPVRTGIELLHTLARRKANIPLLNKSDYVYDLVTEIAENYPIDTVADVALDVADLLLQEGDDGGGGDDGDEDNEREDDHLEGVREQTLDGEKYVDAKIGEENDDANNNNINTGVPQQQRQQSTLSPLARMSPLRFHQSEVHSGSFTIADIADEGRSYRDRVFDFHLLNTPNSQEGPLNESGMC